MPELVGFQDSRSGFRARDFSPDSVIFTADSSSNFSLFSSASASVERCSFASDPPDQDSVSALHSRHELSEALSGPDPDPSKNSVGLRRREKAKVQRVDSSEAETTEDETVIAGSARNSFSRALRECQDRRLRSNLLSRKSDRPRPASLDLNSSLNNSIVNSSSSPRLGSIMNKQPTSVRKAGTFQSPGTPNFRQASAGIQKGWSSERVPPNGRSLNTPLLPYSNNGRTLPSKWEDAERWIFSPVSGDVAFRNSGQQMQRRPRAKSGPLGPPGVAYYQMFSPAGPMFGVGGHNGKLTGSAMNADGMPGKYEQREGAGGGKFLSGTEPCMARSISVHGCSEMLSQLSLPVNQDEKYDKNREESANSISRAVSRRDMATQMSPESSSIQSSSQRHSSFSAMLPIVESRNKHANESEKVRDVLVDERVTMTRWSKKSRGYKSSGRGSRNAHDWKRKAVNFHSSGWEVSTDTSKSISTIITEETRIAAWENLQKAKAEAAIRKLEMKLEKKRSSSMDKIVNKLRSAQKKAQDMRSSSMVTNHQMVRSSGRALLSSRRIRPISSLSGCFTCHAF